MKRLGLLPEAHDAALLVGRVFDPEVDGPSVVVVRGDLVLDVTHLASTVSDLLDRNDLVEFVRGAQGRAQWPLEEVMAATLADDPLSTGSVRFLSPIDLQVVKAAGVTFAKSMVERVIEERAAGDPTRAAAVRAEIDSAIGVAIGSVQPGSVEAAEIKRVLVDRGLWSQYLEVGIGPDPEIFTKAPVLSSVGTGALIGVLERSTWNNPEPELVLAVSSDGRVVGATLGNDVNLRDFEGRSALLLTEAKDNTASCAIGPLIRVFDEHFDLRAAAALEIGLRVEGTDGYLLEETSSMNQMSRGLGELVSHAFGPHHRYPDGFVLFTGTLFAPTQDRDTAGMGFTHKARDRVSISCRELGVLENVVTTAEAAPDWRFGIRSLMANLASRSLLGRPG